MKRCPVCGKLVPRGHGLKRDRKYCSFDCWQTKPPKMVAVEKESGKPIREVVIDTLNSNQNVTVAAQLLGIDKPQLYNWMDKLGIKKVLYWE